MLDLEALNIPDRLKELVREARESGDWGIMEDAFGEVADYYERKTIFTGSLIVRYMAHIYDVHGGVGLGDKSHVKFNEQELDALQRFRKKVVADRRKMKDGQI